MSVSSVGSSSSAYPYPATTSSTSPTSTGISTYQQSYDSLQQYDTSELLAVSFGSQSDATTNVDAVLSQAASLQDQQIAAERAAAASQANGDIQSQPASATSSSRASDPMNVPTLSDITSASEGAASAAIQAYQSAPAGSSFITYA
jgi:hypothetical protein